MSKNGLIGGPQDLNLAIDGTTFGSFCPINFGAQWAGSSVLWPFANEHPDLTGFDTLKRRCGMTRLAGGALQVPVTARLRAGAARRALSPEQAGPIAAAWTAAATWPTSTAITSGRNMPRARTPS